MGCKTKRLHSFNFALILEDDDEAKVYICFTSGLHGWKWLKQQDGVANASLWNGTRLIMIYTGGSWCYIARLMVRCWGVHCEILGRFLIVYWDDSWWYFSVMGWSRFEGQMRAFVRFFVDGWAIMRELRVERLTSRFYYALSRAVIWGCDDGEYWAFRNI